MRNAFLIAPAVYLRPLELSDAPTLAPWFNDQEVARFTLQYRPVSLPREEEVLRRATASDTDLVLGVVVRETNQLVGVTGLDQLDPRNRHARFGITIGDKAQWGKGHGTAAARLVVRHAFETLNLNRVWLHVYEYNERGLKVYEKAGFRREGRLRQDTFRDGRYWDTLVMAALRDEWRTQTPT